jgi:hypothetical protein
MPIDYSGNADILHAFKSALKKLMVDRKTPEALVVAKHIITFAKAGEHDPERLCDFTVEALRIERHRSIEHSRGVERHLITHE